MTESGFFIGNVKVTNLSAISADANIHASNGDNLTATATSLDVNVTNTAVPASLYANISSTATLLDGITLDGPVNALQVFQSARPSQHDVVYNGVVTGVGKANILGSFAVGQAYFTKVSLYGTVSALEGGVTPLNLYLCYSDDGTTWFTSSLGAINFTTTGDFSRDWETSAQYVGFYADSLATLEMYYSLL